MNLFGNYNFKMPGDSVFFTDLHSLTPRKCYEADVISLADKALDYEIAPLTAKMFREFFISGNRSVFENDYHKRRRVLMELLCGALYGNAGKYLEKAVDIAWAICEETAWVIPPHHVSADGSYQGKCLPDAWDDAVELDLYSAETGALLSLLCYFLGDKLDEITDGVFTRRVEYEVRRRVFAPLMQREIRCVYTFINNWVPWIMSNALVCAAVFEKSEAPRRALLARCMSYIDRFVDTYGEDGGCNEGMSYWNAAVGTLFDAAEIIYDFSGGNIDIFSNELLLKMCRFIGDMCIDEEKMLFVNFADCPAYLRNIDGDMVYRMGRRLSAGDLCALGEELRKHKKGDLFEKYMDQYFPYRTVKNLFDDEKAPSEKKESGSFVYKNVEIAVMKKGDFIAVLKGGHNRESHNHNDVGNFLLYYKKTPVIIDVGNMEYTRDTFNQNRYTIWNNRSLYHNLPEIAGREQQCGREFCSDDFEFSGDGATVSYGKAYPSCDEISYAKRSVLLSERDVTLCDEVGTSGDCVYHFMTANLPVIEKNTAVIGNVRAVFSGAEKVGFEKTDITVSPKMCAEWSRTELYRISVTGKKIKTVFEAIK